MTEVHIQVTGESHNPLTLDELGYDPSVIPDTGFVFTKDIAGIAELFYMDDAGNITQLTGGGSLFHSLDDAYNDGRFITADVGPVDIIDNGLIIHKADGVTPHAYFDPTTDTIQFGDPASPVTFDKYGDMNIISGDIGINDNTLWFDSAKTKGITIGAEGWPEFNTAIDTPQVRLTSPNYQIFRCRSVKADTTAHMNIEGPLTVGNELRIIQYGGGPLRMMIGSPSNFEIYDIFGAANVFTVSDSYVDAFKPVSIPSDVALYLDGVSRTKSIMWNSATGRFELNGALGIDGPISNITTGYVDINNGLTILHDLLVDMITSRTGTAYLTLKGRAGYGIKIMTGAGADIAIFYNDNKSLDMVGGAGSWFAPPRMDTTERDTMTGGWGAAEAGRMWYNTTTNQWEGWDGGSIVIIG